MSFYSHPWEGLTKKNRKNPRGIPYHRKWYVSLWKIHGKILDKTRSTRLVTTNPPPWTSAFATILKTCWWTFLDDDKSLLQKNGWNSLPPTFKQKSGWPGWDFQIFPCISFSAFPSSSWQRLIASPGRKDRWISFMTKLEPGSVEGHPESTPPTFSS